VLDKTNKEFRDWQNKLWIWKQKIESRAH